MAEAAVAVVLLVEKAEELGDRMERTKTFDVVGRSFPRKDGVARVTGKERYTCGWQLQRVACGNPLSDHIPMIEVV